MKMPLPRDFQLEIRDKDETTLSTLPDGSAVDPREHSRPRSVSKEQVFANDGSPSFVHSVLAPSHKRQSKYDWCFGLLRSSMAPSLAPFSTYLDTNAGDVDFDKRKVSRREEDDGVDPVAFTGPAPEHTRGDGCRSPVEETACDYTDMEMGTSAKASCSDSVDVSIYDYEGSHSVDEKMGFLDPRGQGEIQGSEVVKKRVNTALQGSHSVDVQYDSDSVDPKSTCCSVHKEDTGRGPNPPLKRSYSETFSDLVDDLSSSIDAPNEASKDWEAHEAESILSDMFQDLGDVCICLLEDGCICNLEECTCQDQDEILKQLNVKVKPQPHADKSSPVKDHGNASSWHDCIRARRPDREKRVPAKGTSTDLHFLHSDNTSDKMVGKKFEIHKANKMSDRVVCKRNLSPCRYETEVDPEYTICGECHLDANMASVCSFCKSTDVDFLPSKHMSQTKCSRKTLHYTRKNSELHEEAETSLDILYPEGTYSDEATENTNFLSVDSAAASRSSLIHAENTKLSAGNMVHKNKASQLLDTDVESVSALNKRLSSMEEILENSTEHHATQTRCCIGPIASAMPAGANDIETGVHESTELHTLELAGTGQSTAATGNAAGGDVLAHSPLRKCHSDSESPQAANALSKTAPDTVTDATKHPLSDPSLQQGPVNKGRGSRIPKRMSGKAGGYTHPASQQGEACQANEAKALNTHVPPSEEITPEREATLERSPMIMDEKTCPNPTRIETEKSPKAYLPQRITFYKHKDSFPEKSMLSVSPVARKCEKPSPTEPPPWNCSTIVQPPKLFARPAPLRSKRNSFHSLVSASSQSSSVKIGDFADRVSSAHSTSATNADSTDTQSSTSSQRTRGQRSFGSQAREPFKPAGGNLEFSRIRKFIPPSNSARSHPDLRLPGCRVEVPVVYPSDRSNNTNPPPAPDCEKQGTKKAEEKNFVGDGQKQLFSEGKMPTLHYVQETCH